MRQLPLLFVAALVGIGAVGGFLTARFFAVDDMAGAQMGDAGSASQHGGIAYWVAPMDPNYRRDEPGLSPMGMELVPVYEDDFGGADDGGVRAALLVGHCLRWKATRLAEWLTEGRSGSDAAGVVTPPVCETWVRRPRLGSPA